MLLTSKSESLTSFIVCCLFLFSTAFAQPTLPEVGVKTVNGMNVIRWVNPYESGFKSIRVERSADSTYNFENLGLVTIGTSKSQHFVDEHPLLGHNWYRVVVTFDSELEWVSNTISIVVDSSTLAKKKIDSKNVKDSLTSLIGKEETEKVIEQAIENSYIKSRYVFTNPFSGNINIEIEDFLEDIYSVYFYDDQNKKVLELPQVNDKVIILDKRNFQKKGLFIFKIFKNKELFESGHVMIY